MPPATNNTHEEDHQQSKSSREPRFVADPSPPCGAGSRDVLDGSMGLRWIKLFESLLDDALWQKLSGDQPKAFIGLMLQVNWKPTEFGCQGCKGSFDIPAGGTAKSAATLAKRARVSRDCMKRLLRLLVREGFILSKCRPRCHSLYVVKNWEKYQADSRDAALGPPPGPHPGPPPGPPPSAPPEVEVKKLRSKEPTCAKSKKPLPIEATEIAIAFRNAQEANDQHLSGTNEAWAKELDKINRLDGADWQLIRDVLMWVTTDNIPRGSWDGWQDKVRSLAGLRVVKGGESKWSKILASYKQSLRSGPRNPTGTLIVDADEADRQARELGFPLGED